MKKRYQVFVSSTYEDLKQERAEVLKTLLRADCIPTQMELFPSADESSWELIKNVIDDCDYYMVIIGSRYGSTAPDKKSYTEMEYEYAIAQNKPVIGFIQNRAKILDDDMDKEQWKRKALKKFIGTIKTQRQCSFWETVSELRAEVITGIHQLKTTRPGIGWIRATEVERDASNNGIIDVSPTAQHADFSEDINTANRISFYFNSGHTILQKYHDNFVDAFNRGCKVKIIISNPHQAIFKDDSPEAVKTRKFYSWNDSSKKVIGLAEAEIEEIIKDVTKKPRKNNFLRYGFCHPTMSMFIFDEQKAYVMPYLPYRDSNRTFKVTMDSNCTFFKHVIESFNDCWKNAMTPDEVEALRD